MIHLLSGTTVFRPNCHYRFYTHRSVTFIPHYNFAAKVNMEEKIINGLTIIGYKGSLADKIKLNETLQEGPKNTEFTILINYLTNEIRVLNNIDEEVNIISSPEDSVAFVMELSSFLKELNCPYSSLIHGHISERFETIPDRLLLLDYLITELMTARILQHKKPEKKIELKLNETDEASHLRKILMTLKFPKPPPNITIKNLFEKLTPSVQNAVKKAGNDLISQPAFNGHLSEKQWNELENVQEDLHKEYKIRREMMLTRLDVTIQSFQWSDKTKGKDELFEEIYTKKRVDLKSDPGVDLSDILAAREDIAIIEKTSNSAVRKNTQTALNKVIIGQVPDRGGRTSEQAPPPPEMPSWQKRVAPPSQGTGRGGGGGYNRGQSSGSYRGGGGGGRDYNNRNSDNSGSYNRGNQDRLDSGRNFDSAGSYATNQDYYSQNSKRAKTYDSYQTNRTTYADQYVQEAQHNQQYHRGRGRGGRGNSNYNRGGRNYY